MNSDTSSPNIATPSTASIDPSQVPVREAYIGKKMDDKKEVPEEPTVKQGEVPHPGQRIKKCKTKHKKEKQRAVSSSSDSDESSESSSSSEDEKRRKTRSKRRSKKTQSKRYDSESESSGSDVPEPIVDENPINDIRQQISELSARLGAALTAVKPKRNSRHRSTRRKSSGPEFKRVDQLWDSSIHNYKLKESAEDDNNEFADYAFLVRRRFDWENKYTGSIVDIKSKDLREALSTIMKDCKSVSLETEEPTIDPNLLFIYLESIRRYCKTLKAEIKRAKKKAVKKLENQRSLCKLLIKYIDADYADTKKTLYPLLETGNITFDLVWALFRPDDIAITSTYGVWDEPRCFRVEYANKYASLTRGEYYSVEGKYIEYDGKAFGEGDFEAEIDSFKGPRKISSLAAYPLKYHSDPAGVKKQIIERGRRFVQTEGMQYKFHKGLAFMKKKKQVLKININGRIVVDPATFRRINPNYQVSVIRPKDADDLVDIDEDDCSCCSSDSEKSGEPKGDEPKLKYKLVEDADGCLISVPVKVDENGDPIRDQRVEQLAKVSFTEDDLLLTTSVVLGFAFSEKLWLEFTLSSVRDIEYNENAFESLVLPQNQKSIVRALVESHKFNAAKTIDDVVQGKGKGLVAVLHGPPGTGKTLTAEGISELLKCPLYMVSAGELGTDPARLELELQKILDIAHSWGAILLLDEADVFLEKRENHDIHRNALVSIFLRLLEYFQGILFLTTNRLETFDDALHSRIHLALRYGELTVKAKKAVWKLFLDLCRKADGCEVTDSDVDTLSRHNLNGRQIKNCVRTAQALALHEKQMLSMSHVKRVLDVAETFERDLKGGTGYVDAMRSYT